MRALLVRLGEKDTATEGHTRRVAMLAVQVGEQLGLAARAGSAHARARRAAARHGQAHRPVRGATKPGPLDDDEFAEIRKHPEAGERLLRELGGFAPDVLRLVLDHHERLDGSGYPRGLAGDELDARARILAVCDVYDALVSDRVYRPRGRRSARSRCCTTRRSSTRTASPRSRACSRRRSSPTSPPRRRPLPRLLPAPRRA